MAEELKEFELEGLVRDTDFQNIDIEHGKILDAEFYALIQNKEGELFHTLSRKRFLQEKKGTTTIHDDHSFEMRALNYLNQLKYVIKEGVKIKVTVRGSESDNFYEVVSNYRILEDK